MLIVTLPAYFQAKLNLRAKLFVRRQIYVPQEITGRVQ